ncbi:MAG: hypothetical protein ACUVWX_00115 [Kiritimatiellia bacterium]
MLLIVFRVSICAAALFLVAMYWYRLPREKEVAPQLPVPSSVVPAERPLAAVPRAWPKRFPPNTHMPPVREALVVGFCDTTIFDPARDLVRVEDPRVWWESDNNQEGDAEDDHLMHRNCEEPFKKVVELVTARGGRLKVHDAYRPTGLHSPRSLHRVGRALDLTCDGPNLEELAKICWVAGFDWVYYEADSKHGAHIHCSIRDHNNPAAALTTPFADSQLPSNLVR